MPTDGDTQQERHLPDGTHPSTGSGTNRRAEIGVGEGSSSVSAGSMLEETGGQTRQFGFLASLNHEIRTPLGAILGQVDLLLNDGALSLQHRRHVENIRAAGSALFAVTNDVLNFALADTRDIALEPRPFDFREVLVAAASSVRRQAEGKGLAFEVDIDPVLPVRLVGDPDRLRQIVLNLLGNAVKFTSRGHVRLKVDVEAREGGSVRLLLSVADTGIGMSPSRLAGLFDEGLGQDHEIRNQFGGAGLALKVSKRLIEAMGGSIGIDSIPHFGSTAWITLALPVAPLEVQEQEPRARGGSAARILLVEDDEINREIARAILEAGGHDVDVACDGSNAVWAVQSTMYHLVLMDVQMPVMDGISATRLIRSLPGPECDVPIVAITANVLPEQVRAMKEAGMNGHVAKPFRKDELLSLVDRWASDSLTQVIHRLSGLKSLAGR